MDKIWRQAGEDKRELKFKTVAAPVQARNRDADGNLTLMVVVVLMLMVKTMEPITDVAMRKSG